jgi:hypothetical protein
MSTQTGATWQKIEEAGLGPFVTAFEVLDDALWAWIAAIPKVSRDMPLDSPAAKLAQPSFALMMAHGEYCMRVLTVCQMVGALPTSDIWPLREPKGPLHSAASVVASLTQQGTPELRSLTNSYALMLDAIVQQDEAARAAREGGDDGATE